jgi:hypothetical protein
MEDVTSERIRYFIIGLKVQFPKLRIRVKKPWWMNIFIKAPLIKKLKWFNYTHTIGNSIFLPENWDNIKPINQLIILHHEREHLFQFKRYGLFLMLFLYLFIFFPIGLSYYRAKFEREALAQSLKFRIEYFGSNSYIKQLCREQYIKNLSGISYLYAWPFKKRVIKWFKEDWEKVVN